MLSIPIQALTVRKKGDLEAPKDGVLASTESPVDRSRNEEIQGVFVVNNGHAEFRKVETGITGATDIEVLSGLEEGDQIITGSYKVIRTIRNDAPSRSTIARRSSPTRELNGSSAGVRYNRAKWHRRQFSTRPSAASSSSATASSSAPGICIRPT